MGIGITGNQCGILCEANIVPLIDILLVLLVIFMIIPHRQMGLQADLPRQASLRVVVAPAEAIVVQILSDGSLRINRLLVKREELRDRLERSSSRPPRCISSSGWFSRVSSGCSSSGWNACRRRFLGRLADF